AIREHEGQREGTAEVVEALDAIRAGDLDSLRRMLDRHPLLAGRVHRGAWSTLLEAIAQPDVVGEQLGTELGVDRRVVWLLAGRGSELEQPLNLAASCNRAELVAILLEAGADPTAAGPWGTALQTAVYHGSKEAADVLAPRGIVPDALWVAAIPAPTPAIAA